MFPYHQQSRLTRQEPSSASENGSTSEERVSLLGRHHAPLAASTFDSKDKNNKNNINKSSAPRRTSPGPLTSRSVWTSRMNPSSPVVLSGGDVDGDSGGGGGCGIGPAECRTGGGDSHGGGSLNPQLRNHSAQLPNSTSASAGPHKVATGALPKPSAAAAATAVPKRRYLGGGGGGSGGRHHLTGFGVGPIAGTVNSDAVDAGHVFTAAAAAATARSRAYAAFLSMRRRTVILINLVSVMERMDEQIVPALSRPLGCAFRAGPHQLGLITFARALVQAVASPIGGLAGHYFDRVTVLFIGCAIWGFFCTAFSFATSVNQGIAAWAFNGVGLSLIIPNSQSLVADYYAATERGEAFGALMLTGAFGGMLGAMFATNLGGMSPMGVAGWRLAFIAVGAVSLAIGAFTFLLAVDPTRRRHQTAAAAAGGASGSKKQPNGGRAHRCKQHQYLNDDLSYDGPVESDAAAAAVGGGGSGGATWKAQLSLPDGPGGGRYDNIDRKTEMEESLDRQDSSKADPDLEPVDLYDTEYSAASEVYQPLLRGGGDGGGDAASPSASAEGEAASFGEPSPRRPLLRRHQPSAAAAAAAIRRDDGSSGSGSGGGGSGDRYMYGISHGHKQRYSYDHGKRRAGLTTKAMRSMSVPMDLDLDFGRVTGCAVEGSGYESAATAAAAVLGSSSHDGRAALTWSRIWAMITTPTFLIIILQGIVGSTPWNALVFLTLYLQLMGFSDATASSLMALLLGGTAAGALVGGWLGDRVAERYPHHGRVLLVQFSVGIGVPLSVFIMRGLPMVATPSTAVLYGTLMLTKGVLTSWAAPACNNPVFAEIVPPDMRNLVYAFDRSFEGAISALGAPLVGMAAERWFGFTGVAGGAQGCENNNITAGAEPDLPKARALGDAMLLFMAVPWTLCTLFYTGLHWSYPRDRAKALRPQVVDVLAGRGVGSGGTVGMPYKRAYGGSGGALVAKVDV